MKYLRWPDEPGEVQGLDGFIPLTFPNSAVNARCADSKKSLGGQTKKKPKLKKGVRVRRWDLLVCLHVSVPMCVRLSVPSVCMRTCCITTLLNVLVFLFHRLARTRPFLFVSLVFDQRQTHAHHRDFRPAVLCSLS
jgi:hypothetical protein